MDAALNILTSEQDETIMFHAGFGDIETIYTAFTWRGVDWPGGRGEGRAMTMVAFQELESRRAGAMRFKDEVCIVTAAGQGIGRAGWNVFACGFQERSGFGVSEAFLTGNGLRRHTQFDSACRILLEPVIIDAKLQDGARAGEIGVRQC